MTSLQERKSEFTKRLLIEAAIELIDENDINDLSFKRIAEQAGISERTMFRQFSSRDAFLDALAISMHNQLSLPSLPDSARDLSEHLRELFHQLDKQPRKVEVLLGADLLPRVLRTSGQQRLEDLKALLKKDYPHVADDVLTKTAANLRFVMNASTWRYYRKYFEFDLTTSIQCADMLVKQSLSLLDAFSATNSSA